MKSAHLTATIATAVSTCVNAVAFYDALDDTAHRNLMNTKSMTNTAKALAIAGAGVGVGMLANKKISNLHLSKAANGLNHVAPVLGTNNDLPPSIFPDMYNYLEDFDTSADSLVDTQDDEIIQIPSNYFYSPYFEDPVLSAESSEAIQNADFNYVEWVAAMAKMTMTIEEMDTLNAFMEKAMKMNEPNALKVFYVMFHIKMQEVLSQIEEVKMNEEKKETVSLEMTNLDEKQGAELQKALKEFRLNKDDMLKIMSSQKVASSVFKNAIMSDFKNAIMSDFKNAILEASDPRNSLLTKAMKYMEMIIID